MLLSAGALLGQPPARSARSCAARTRSSPQRQAPAGGHRQGPLPHRAGRLKTLYLSTRPLDPKGLGQARWTTRWKPALNAFAITFADRIPAAETLQPKCELLRNLDRPRR